MAQQPTTTPEDMQGIQDAMAMQSLRTAALRQAQQQPQSRAAIMQKYFGTPTPLPAQKAPAPTQAPSGLGAAIGGVLPEPGSAGMAGLGAAGRALLQLGGYQERPMTLGQMLGQAGDVGMRAFSEAQEKEQAAEQAAAQAQAAAEQQKYEREQEAKKFGLEEKKFAFEQEQANRQTSKALGFKLQDVKHPDGTIGKAEVTYVTPGSPEAEALNADQYGRVVRWDTFLPKDVKKTELEPVEGVFLENGEKSKKRIYRKTTAEGGYVTVVEDPDAEGGFRPVKDTEEFISSENIDREALSIKEVKNLANETRTQSRGVKTLNKLYTDLDAVEGGFAGLATSLSAKAKTLVGKDLTPKEIARQLAIGMQQGVLGQVRVDVLGPGVMTEQDAERLIQYLGGDLRNLSTNPQTVKVAIGKVLKDKSNDYNTDLPFYQRQRSLSTSASTLPNFKPVEIPEIRDPAAEVLAGPDQPSPNVDALVDSYLEGQQGG
tara:strand:- start:235 stop:1695 length:1461 start_codon:yes stop_codon:yes gene_type:complete